MQAESPPEVPAQAEPSNVVQPGQGVLLAPSVGDGIRFGYGVFLAAALGVLVVVAIALVAVLAFGVALPGHEQLLPLVR